MLIRQASEQTSEVVRRPSWIPPASSPFSRTATVDGTEYKIRKWADVEGLERRIAIFETVFWEPDDTRSLRELIRTTDVVRGKTILEIGTGSGLLPLCCLQAGAGHVVATDVNPAAVANAKYNAGLLGLGSRLDVRLVPLDDAGAYAVIAEGEQFDLIISNPPWENQQPASIDEYALYDPGFALLHSLLSGMQRHLKDDGRAWLAYGCREAILAMLKLAPELGLKVTIFDPRAVEDLPNLFLPGMLLEVRPD